MQMSTQSQKKKERLMEKAEELFMKCGYNRVSMDQIAAEAGISKMTIYKYYPSKDELFIAVMEQMSDFHTKIIMKMLSEKEHTLEKIESLYHYITDISRQMSNDLSKDILERPYLLEKITAIKYQRTLDMWRYILEDGIKKGDIRPVDVDFVSVLLLNLPMAFMKSEYMDEENTREWLYENLFDFMKYGLLGGKKDICVKNEMHKKGGSGNETGTDEG